jgi:hypothetical protein
LAEKAADLSVAGMVSKTLVMFRVTFGATAPIFEII